MLPPNWNVDQLLSVLWRLVALGLIIVEALTQKEPRQALLVLYAAMLGLPTIIKSRGGNGGG